jgi:hypothetical protein
MERALIEKGLTPKEVVKALSLARVRQEVGLLYPPRRELCYQLLTEKDRTLQFRLISAVKQEFDMKKSKYVRVEEMKKLLEHSLSQEDAEQAISLAEANNVVRWCIPYTREIEGEPSYELLTQEEVQWEEEEELQDLEEDTQIRMKERRTSRRTQKRKRKKSANPLL